MPIIQQIKRINPLDLNRNAKIGVAFPLDENNMFEGTDTVKEQIRANLINVLLTKPGERVMEPNFGVNLKGYLFEPNIEPAVIEDIIKNQVSIYVPQISLRNIDIGEISENHTLFVRIDYVLLSDGSEDSVQTNFQG